MFNFFKKLFGLTVEPTVPTPPKRVKKVVDTKKNSTPKKKVVKVAPTPVVEVKKRVTKPKVVKEEKVVVQEQPTTKRRTKKKDESVSVEVVSIVNEPAAKKPRTKTSKTTK